MTSRSAAEVFGRSVDDVFGGGRSAADVFGGSRGGFIPPKSRDYASMKSNPIVFMDIEIDGTNAGQVVPQPCVFCYVLNLSSDVELGTLKISPHAYWYG